jgi:hypothetical protein
MVLRGDIVSDNIIGRDDSMRWQQGMIVRDGSKRW